MLTPSYLLHAPEAAEEIAEKLHQTILNRIIERVLHRLKRGDNYILTAVDKWQIETLLQAGYLLDDIQKEIAAATPYMISEIAEAMEDAGVRALDYDDKIYREAGLDPVPLVQSPSLTRIMQRDYEATIGEWKNFVGTTANAAQQTFIRVCDNAYHLAVTGAISPAQAVREALEELVNDGVYVQYPTGHRDTIETATVRAVRTGISQASAHIQLARMDEMDMDLVLVSSHLGARPEHAVWQGKVYSRSGNPDYPNFVESTGYGTVTGLCGANCRHNFSPWFEGMNNPFEQYDSEENLKQYELEQRQRTLERRIRNTKHKVMDLDTARQNANGDLKDMFEADYQRKSALLQKQNKAYNDFCKDNNLKKQSDRISIAKWDRKQAAKARAAADKYAAEKMAAESESSNDWSGTHPRFVTKTEKDAIKKYAENSGIIIPSLKTFDGDPELLKASIDALHNVRDNFPVDKPVVLSIGNIRDDEEFGSTRDFHITVNAKALRDRAVTERNIAKGNMFASKTLEDIVIHEYGHVISYAKGNKGVDLVQKAYYNTYKKELYINDLPSFLIERVSKYAATMKKKSFREIIPEVLAKNNSQPDDFTQEFVSLLKRWMME